MFNELKCPMCKNDSFLSPNIKIYISPCFHKICEQCLIKIFGVEYAPCPECGIMLRRINFISSTFESIEVEREIKIRQLLNIHYKYNILSKTHDKYNDWLEEYENCIFSLMKLKNEKLIKSEIQKIVDTPTHKLNIYKQNLNIMKTQELSSIKNIESNSMDNFLPTPNNTTSNVILIKKNYLIPKSLFKLKDSTEITNMFIIQLAYNTVNKIFN